MEENEYRHYLTLTHGGLPHTPLFAIFAANEQLFSVLLVKKLAEFINKTENFRNFVVGNHSGFFGVLLFFAFTKILKNPLITKSSINYLRFNL